MHTTPPDWQARLEHWAAARPAQWALLHKQHGRWGAHCWKDVAMAAGHLRGLLAQQGLGPHARLAVSGALEPQLIGLVLAAQGLGAQVIAVDRYAQGTALRNQLQAADATHAFVQHRKTVSAWLACGYTNAALRPLYSAQSVAHDSGSWHIVPLARLTRDTESPRVRRQSADLRRGLRQHTVLWVDEGTEWREGLEHVLSDWLAQGTTLAAPEVSASSARDRYEIQPQRILVSAQRQQHLHAQWRARLPHADNKTRRWIEQALVRPSGLLSSWLLRRMARLDGLSGQHGIQATPGRFPDHGDHAVKVAA